MKIEITQEELSELKQIQRNVTGTDYIKIPGIRMLHRGFSPRTVSESTGTDVSAGYRYAALYSCGGISTLTANGNRGCCGMLSSYETGLLRTELKLNIYTDSGSISSWIKTVLGVSYTPEVRP